MKHVLSGCRESNKTLPGFSLPSVLLLSGMISVVLMILLLSMKQRRQAVWDLQNTITRTHAIAEASNGQSTTMTYSVNGHPGYVSKTIQPSGLNLYEKFNATDLHGNHEKWVQVVKRIQFPASTRLILTDSHAGVIQFPTAQISGAAALRYPVWQVNGFVAESVKDIYSLKTDIINYTLPDVVRWTDKNSEEGPGFKYYNTEEEILESSGKYYTQLISEGDVTIPEGSYTVENWYIIGNKIRIKNGTQIHGSVWILNGRKSVQLFIGSNVGVNGVLCVDGSVSGSNWTVKGVLICRYFETIRQQQVYRNRLENFTITGNSIELNHVNFPFFWNEGREFKF